MGHRSLRFCMSSLFVSDRLRGSGQLTFQMLHLCFFTFETGLLGLELLLQSLGSCRSLSDPLLTCLQIGSNTGMLRRCS